MCLKPIRAKLSLFINDRGRTPVIIMKDIEPYKEFDRPVLLPCGKCFGCLENRKFNWVNRMKMENELHDSGTFLTLTYNPDNLPEKCDKTAVQRFIKRLRNVSRDYGISFPRDFKYFFVSERGSLNNRPHYHAILFGVDMMSEAWKPRLATFKDGYPVYCSAVVEKLWPFGFNVVAPVTGANIGYVAKYIVKQDSDDCFSLKSLSIGNGYIFDIIRQGRRLKYSLKSDSPDLLARGFFHLPSCRSVDKVIIPKNIYQKLWDVDLKLAAETSLLRRLNVRSYHDYNEFMEARDNYLASYNNKQKKEKLKGKINDEKIGHINPR